MINDINNDNTLQDFLEESPYTQEQKADLTFWIDGLLNEGEK